LYSEPVPADFIALPGVGGLSSSFIFENAPDKFDRSTQTPANFVR